jgi:transposase
MSNSNRQTQRRYPPELRARAVRMVLETMRETGERHGVVTRVAVELGIGSETVRHWVKQAEIDEGLRPGVTTDERQRIAELEKEVRELRRANEILKAAAGFFARELDPRLPK